MGSHEPLRRCVGCGEVKPKRTLVRLALHAAREEEKAVIAVDSSAGRLAGRGAYLCAHGAPDAGLRVRGSCLRAAVGRRALSGSLRTSASLSAELIESSDRG